MLKCSLQYGDSPDRIGIWKWLFLRRGENRSTQRKTSWSKDKNRQQTQPTYDAETGNRTWATLVGGECSHHCAIPALQKLKIRKEGKDFIRALSATTDIFLDISVGHMCRLTSFKQVCQTSVLQHHFTYSSVWRGK